MSSSVKNEGENIAGEKSASGSVAKKIFSDYISPIILALIIALFVTKCLIFNARVPTGSMIPTIEAGDRFIGWRPSYLFDDPKQGDIVVFRSYELTGDVYDCILVKRVIATGGDRVRISDGIVIVNGIPLDEAYLQDGVVTSDMDEIYVPKGCCFVMGDNRTASYDARYWLDPFVRYEDIYAKVVWIIHL